MRGNSMKILNNWSINNEIIKNHIRRFCNPALSATAVPFIDKKSAFKNPQELIFLKKKFLHLLA
jgi:hypothetical protein